MKPIYYGECPDCKKRMRLKADRTIPKHECAQRPPNEGEPGYKEWFAERMRIARESGALR